MQITKQVITENSISEFNPLVELLRSFIRTLQATPTAITECLNCGTRHPDRNESGQLYKDWKTCPNCGRVC